MACAPAAGGEWRRRCKATGTLLAAGAAAGALLVLGGPKGASGLGSLMSNPNLNITEILPVVNLLNGPCGGPTVLPWLVELISVGGPTVEGLLNEIATFPKPAEGEEVRRNASEAIIRQVASNTEIQQIIQGELMQNISNAVNISCLMESSFFTGVIQNQEDKIAKDNEGWSTTVGGIIVDSLFQNLPTIFNDYGNCGGGLQQLLELLTIFSKALTKPPQVTLTFTPQRLLDFAEDQEQAGGPPLSPALQAFNATRNADELVAAVCPAVW